MSVQIPLVACKAAFFYFIMLMIACSGIALALAWGQP